MGYLVGTTRLPDIHVGSEFHIRRAAEVGSLDVGLQRDADTRRLEHKMKVEVKNLSAWFRDEKEFTGPWYKAFRFRRPRAEKEKQVLHNISVEFEQGEILGIIGPSGSGKSTLIRCINRLHELAPGARVEGEVFFDGQNIYGKGVDPVDTRRQIGMVFQKANPFPNMTVLGNVVAGPKLNGLVKGKDAQYKMAKSVLEEVGLWSEVKDGLKRPGGGLSGGQQQRLCVARALANKPKMLLMDEPCSALDPKSTAIMEGLIIDLAKVRGYGIAIVTHNMGQAKRIADNILFVEDGRVIEYNTKYNIFNGNAKEQRTRDFVEGKFG